MRQSFTLLFAMLTVGCATRPLYQPVKFAEPSPFTKPGCKLAIEDIRSDQLQVEGKPEAEWLATRTAAQQASFQQDKRTGQAKFTEYVQKKHSALLVSPGTKEANLFVMRPTFTQWDPGVYAFVGGRPSASVMTFDVLNGDGAVVDQFTFTGKELGFSSGERMWAAYITAAWAIDQYIHDRWSCAAN